MKRPNKVDLVLVHSNEVPFHLQPLKGDVTTQLDLEDFFMRRLIPWLISSVAALLIPFHSHAQDAGTGALIELIPPSLSASDLFSSSPLGRNARNSVPSRVENRHLLSPVKSQSGCGSCTIFAATALLEAAILRDHASSNTGIRSGNPVLSEQFSIDCAGNLGRNVCKSGWWTANALDNILRHAATDDPSLRQQVFSVIEPTDARTKDYVSQGGQCRININHYIAEGRKQYPFGIYDYQRVSANTLADLKALIHTYGAVATAMQWGQFVANTNNVYKRISQEGGHAFVIAGYDDAKSAFLVRNSHGSGTSWGIAHDSMGTFWLDYTHFRDLGYEGFYVIQRTPTLPSNYAPTPTPTPENKKAVVVVREGTGVGIVESTDSSISCSPLCSTTVNKGQSGFTLRAKPNANASFSGWGGACTKAGQSPTCTLDAIHADTTVFAKFTQNLVSSDLDPRLLSALGSKASEFINTSTIGFKDTNATFARGLNKIETLAVTTPTITFDPSFVLDDGRYNAATNTGVSVLFAKRLMVSSELIPRNGKLTITIKRADFVAGSLDGQRGTDGSNGANGAAGGSCTTGGNGGNGTSGQPGSSGKTRQFDSKVVIAVGSVVNSNFQKIPPEKIQFNFDFAGYDGGRGGNGGTGGNGGNGGRGGNARSGTFDCSCGGGNGGRGGNGAVGGDAGNGADAGSGANLMVLLPDEYYAAMGSFNTTAGQSGQVGLVGNSGTGGTAGSAGSGSGFCSGGRTGVAGTTPTPLISNSIRGLEGLIGRSAGSLLYASTDSLLADTQGTMSDGSTPPISDLTVEGSDAQGLTLSWTGTQALNTLNFQVTQASTTSPIFVRGVPSKTGKNTLLLKEIGSGKVKISAQDLSGNEQASVSFDEKSGNSATAKGITVWSSGQKTGRSIFSFIDPALFTGTQDVYVTATAPNFTGVVLYLTSSGWVLNTSNDRPTPLLNGATQSRGRLGIVENLDLSAPELAGLEVAVGVISSSSRVASFQQLTTQWQASRLMTTY